jgi:hypothetical protein
VSDERHPSDSAVQVKVESVVLANLEEQIGVKLEQGREVPFGAAKIKPDGISAGGADVTVIVEVFAHVGKLKGGQFHKVSTDALKLIAMRERHPDARLILAFVDHEAAASVVGWRAAVLEHYGIEKLVIDISAGERTLVQQSQTRQKMINASADGSDL